VKWWWWCSLSTQLSASLSSSLVRKDRISIWIKNSESKTN